MSTATAPERNRYHFDMDQVRQWYEEEGASVREVARRLGASDRTTWRHMDAAGIRMRPPGGMPPGVLHEVSPEERAAIIQAVRDAEKTGERQVDIALRFGRSEHTVRRIMQPRETRSWKPVAEMLAARLARHASCEAHPASGPDPDCPACGDRRAYDAYLAACGNRALEGGKMRARYEQVRSLHASGLRGVEIDRKLGWKDGHASSIQRRLGLNPALPAPPAGELAALYEQLRFVNAVAAHLGCSKYIASRMLKDAGIAVVPRRHTLATMPPHKLDDHLEAIREARLGPDRATIPQLAARYGVTTATMSGYLDQRGIATYRIVTAAEHDEILRLRAAGLSKNEIGRRLGRPGITIAKHLRPGPRPKLK